MYTFIVVSYPLARIQVVIYIFDIGWLTVISFVLHTLICIHLQKHTFTCMHTFKYIHSCVCEHL